MKEDLAQLVDVLEMLEQRHQVIEDTLEEIRVELQWGVRNRRIEITSLPLETNEDETPADR